MSCVRRRLTHRVTVVSDTVDVVCQTSFDTQSDCSQWYSGCRVSDVVWHTPLCITDYSHSVCQTSFDTRLFVSLTTVTLCVRRRLTHASLYHWLQSLCVSDVVWHMPLCITDYSHSVCQTSFDTRLFVSLTTVTLCVRRRLTHASLYHWLQSLCVSDVVWHMPLCITDYSHSVCQTSFDTRLFVSLTTVTLCVRRRLTHASLYHWLQSLCVSDVVWHTTSTHHWRFCCIILGAWVWLIVAVSMSRGSDIVHQTIGWAGGGGVVCTGNTGHQ